ncbi:MAG: recombinase family protein [Muribaculaceae bacterium]|nr:recombinase family protein [Muribaculaceae bacterium]
MDMSNITCGMHGLTKDESGKLKSEWGEVYGYVRVSTKEQNTDRQYDAMIEYGVDEKHIFMEHVSGKNFNRPAYKRLIRMVRKGDIIVIKSIDRLGRNYSDIIDQWRMITQDIGCGIHVIDMPTLNTSGDPADLLSRFITDMMLQVLSFVAENERENTLKRQKEGIEAARKRGAIKTGRPRVKIPFEFWEIYISWKTGEVKPKELLKYCKDKYNMCSRTFYRRIRELDMRYGDLSPSKLRDLIVDEEFADGIEFSMERCEAAIGVYNSYTNNPEHEAALKKKQKEQEDVEEDDEEEIRRIILQKRQADFREKFGIQDTGEEPTVKRGRKGTTQKQRQAIRDAEKATTNAIKTVIIN